METELSCQYHLITHDDRLETAAKDIERDFLYRTKWDALFENVYESYMGNGDSLYAETALVGSLY